MEKVEWILLVYYGATVYKLRAVPEYSSAQIYRIRVYGKTSSILLETNYPLATKNGARKPIRWKLLEGTLQGEQSKNSRLLIDIFERLEEVLKDYKPFTG